MKKSRRLKRGAFFADRGNDMSKMNVLVVDDHEPNLTLYARAVKKIGAFETFCFQSSKEALVWAAAHDVRLAIVDYQMPAPNGLEFTNALRGLAGKTEVPVIMITGNQREDLRSFASTRGGIDAFLLKPVKINEFLILAKQLLEQGRPGPAAQAEKSAKRITIGADAGRPSVPVAYVANPTFERLCEALALRHPTLKRHSQLTSLFSGRVATALGLPDWEVKLITSAARLHDIGMIGTPDSILSKASEFDDREWEIVKEHPEAGLQMLKDEDTPLMIAASVMAMTHHERVDGSGYPKSLQGRNIPLYGRIVAVADGFAAMVSKRPFRHMLTAKAAFAKLKELAGTRFDAAIVEALRSAPLSDIFSTYEIL
jgi:response regulator RpfG family c-di-GMP phosphodiesterase